MVIKIKKADNDVSFISALPPPLILLLPLPVVWGLVLDLDFRAKVLVWEVLLTLVLKSCPRHDSIGRLIDVFFDLLVRLCGRLSSKVMHRSRSAGVEERRCVLRGLRRACGVS